MFSVFISDLNEQVPREKDCHPRQCRDSLDPASYSRSRSDIFEGEAFSKCTFMAHLDTSSSKVARLTLCYNDKFGLSTREMKAHLGNHRRGLREVCLGIEGAKPLG